MIRKEINNFICREDFPITDTEQGRYRGFLDGNVFCFRGIPYAEAKRFQDPEPVKSFAGIRNALDYGPVDPSMSYNIDGKVSEDNILVQRRLWYRGENCLNLNIWTQSLKKDDKKPVMVWMHGGGFSAGNALDLYSYDGWEMSHCYDVVLITVNHRLNMSGYLDLSNFGEQYAHTGILGMLDLVAALKWVHENIASFGGDPENVTIYGQSGGGAKVSTLMQMPSADGLYRKAIVQSGVFPKNTFQNISAKIADLVVKYLKLDKNNISAIETMDYEQLGKAVCMACYALGSDPFVAWVPIPDGKEYMGNPLDVGFRKESDHIPMIVGSCLAEFLTVPQGNKKVWSMEKKKALLSEKFGEKALDIWDAFAEAYPEVDSSYAVCLDTMVRSATIEYLNLRKREAHAPAYNYIFSFESSLMGGQLTGHNGDIHFMFHNALYMPAMYKPEVTSRLQDEMAGAWAAFATTGSPNGKNLPKWKEYNEKRKNCLLFGDTTLLKENHDEELLSTIKLSMKSFSAKC